MDKLVRKNIDLIDDSKMGFVEVEFD